MFVLTLKSPSLFTGLPDWLLGVLCSGFQWLGKGCAVCTCFSDEALILMFLALLGNGCNLKNFEWQQAKWRLA